MIIMLKIKYKKRGLFTIEHNWFCDEYNNQSKEVANIAFYHGIKEDKIDNFLGKCEILKQYSLLTDLQLDTDELWKLIKKKDRYEIRRAEREGIKHQLYLSNEFPKELLDGFERTYNKMYKHKKINASFNRSLIYAYINSNAMVFSVGYYNSVPVVYHSYIVDDNNCRFFYSTSSFREAGDDAKIIARINRYLHWKDICYFKDLGKKIYDWGGLSNPDNPNGIDSFKMGFGGSLTYYYNVIVYLGLIGKLGYCLKKGYYFNIYKGKTD